MKKKDLAKYDKGRVIKRDKYGPVIIRKTQREGRLYEGTILKIEGDGLWRVERVNDSGAYVRCVVGRRKGTSVLISAMSDLSTVSKSELERRLTQQVETRESARDETRCPNCWTGEETEIDGADRGRDPGCTSHIVSTKVRPTADGTRVIVEEDPKDVKKVLALRTAGFGYRAIELKMKWPDKKGGRAFRIVKKAGAWVKATGQPKVKAGDRG